VQLVSFVSGSASRRNPNQGDSHAHGLELRRMRGVLGLGLVSVGLEALAGVSLGVALTVFEPRNYGWPNVVATVAALGVLGLLT
jgi:hypothetical protein